MAKFLELVKSGEASPFERLHISHVHEKQQSLKEEHFDIHKLPIILQKMYPFTSNFAGIITVWPL